MWPQVWILHCTLCLTVQIISVGLHLVGMVCLNFFFFLFSFLFLKNNEFYKYRIVVGITIVQAKEIVPQEMFAIATHHIMGVLATCV